jgi:hypothetical protein
MKSGTPKWNAVPASLLFNINKCKIWAGEMIK